ncbi:hypothetical protein D3C73_1407280 [compost metagenome]
MQVFVVHQRHEVGVFVVEAPRKLNDPANGIHRRQTFKIQLTLGLTQLQVTLFQHAKKQFFLAGVVVIDEALVDTGTFGDVFEASTFEPLFGEYRTGGHKDRLLRALGVACALALGCFVD